MRTKEKKEEKRKSDACVKPQERENIYIFVYARTVGFDACANRMQYYYIFIIGNKI